MVNRMKRRAVVAIALALALLGLFVTAVGWNDVLSAIAQVSLSAYAGAFLGTLLTFGFRSLVWSRVLTVVDEPRPYWLVLAVFLTGSFVKYVTPYGQVASGVGVAAIVNRYTDAAYEESLAAVVSADFLNYLPYYTFGAIGATYVLSGRSVPVAVQEYVLLLAGLVVAIWLILGLMWIRRSFIVAGVLQVVLLLRGVVARFSRSRARSLTRENVEQRLKGFYTTLDLLSRNRRAMVVALVYAHVAWLGLAGALYVTAVAIGVPISIGVALLVVAVSKVGFLLPTPGGLGGVEATLATALFVLTPMGIALATATAILFRFATYWFTVFVGGTTSVALTVRDPLPPE